MQLLHYRVTHFTWARTILRDRAIRIQALRKAKGWAQTDLAVHLNLNRGHISDIELRKREVGIITLQVMARGAGHHDGETS